MTWFCPIVEWCYKTLLFLKTTLLLPFPFPALPLLPYFPLRLLFPFSFFLLALFSSLYNLFSPSFRSPLKLLFPSSFPSPSFSHFASSSLLFSLLIFLFLLLLLLRLLLPFPSSFLPSSSPSSCLSYSFPSNYFSSTCKK